MSERREMTADETQLLYIDLLFSQYTEQEPSEDLRVISKYFEHLGNQIFYRPPRVDVSSALLTRFESVCLLLRDRLRIYPETVHAQVEQILKDSGLERMFAVIAALSNEEMKRTELQNFLSRAISALPSLFRPTLNQDVISVPTRQSMFEAKIALNRIAQILRYASSIEVVDHDNTTEDLKDHYDPSLVDKAKILTLLGLLRVQTNNVPDMDVRGRLLENVDRIEEELRRPKPRWGRIIAAIFVVFGFLADLKTLNPTVYDSLYRTVHAIVNVLHVEGSVEHQRRKPLLPLGDETPAAVLPSLPKLPSKEDEGDAQP
jgi:hypothetical protein